MACLGLDGTIDYSYRLLASPSASLIDLGTFIGVVLPDLLWNDASQRPYLDIMDLGSDLAEQDKRLSDLIAANDSSPSNKALYLSQREALRRQAAQLGLLDANTGTIQGQLEGLAIHLPDLYAAPGSVFLDAIGGTITINGLQTNSAPATIPSNIKAYSDSSISVINSAPVILVGEDMVIDDSKVVDIIDGKYTVFSPGAVYFNRQGGSSGANASQPTGSITISQNVRKTIPLPTGFPAAQPPADIYLLGSVVNEIGTIVINNTTDSVIVSGEVRGSSLSISSAGTFSLNSDSWFHSGGDPRQYLKVDEKRAQAFAAGTDGGGKFKGSMTSVTASQAEVNSAASKNAGTIFSRGDISISALYLNIDGLIQSGTPTLSMTVDATFNPSFSTSLLDNNGNGIDGISFAAVEGKAVGLAGYVDVSSHTINLYDIKSKGGNINLTGQIMSTGAGKVLAFNGQPTLTLTNNSSWNLVTGAIDLAPISGKITIVDTPRIALLPSSVDTSTNTITFASAHNLADGAAIYYQYSNSINSKGAVDSSSPISGLLNNTTYYVKVVDARTVKLQQNAGASQYVAITGHDSGRAASFVLATIKKTEYAYSTSNSTISKTDSVLSLNGMSRDLLSGNSNSTWVASVKNYLVGTISQRSDSTTSTTFYNPTSGLTYVWTEGQDKTITTTNYKSQSSFNLFQTIGD
jgi:hypothetical protein